MPSELAELQWVIFSARRGENNRSRAREMDAVLVLTSFYSNFETFRPNIVFATVQNFDLIGRNVDQSKQTDLLSVRYCISLVT